MSIKIKPIKEGIIYQINDKYTLLHNPGKKWVCNEPLTPQESKAWKDYHKGIAAKP